MILSKITMKTIFLNDWMSMYCTQKLNTTGLYLPNPLCWISITLCTVWIFNSVMVTTREPVSNSKPRGQIWPTMGFYAARESKLQYVHRLHVFLLKYQKRKLSSDFKTFRYYNNFCHQISNCFYWLLISKLFSNLLDVIIWSDHTFSSGLLHNYEQYLAFFFCNKCHLATIWSCTLNATLSLHCHDWRPHLCFHLWEPPPLQSSVPQSGVCSVKVRL